MRQALRFTVAVAMAMAFALARPLSAHHSTSAEFDTGKPIEFTGQVKKVEWMNPHIYVHVVAKDEAGKVVEYRVEGGAPNMLFRLGWRPDSLKPGDRVTVNGMRAKNSESTNIGQASIKTADGKMFFKTPGQAGVSPEQ